MDNYRSSATSSVAIKQLNDTKNTIKSSTNDYENTTVLEIGMEKFNPSTSPPMNSFMDRLAVRNLLYRGK
jgi:hypothetical protein